MARVAPGALRAARRSRRDRLGTRFARLGERGCKKGGEETAKNPTDKGKPGSKRHVISDRNGIPLAVILTAANVHDSNVFEELVDAIEPIKRPRGRPRKRPKKLHADKGYDTRQEVPGDTEEAWHQEPHRPTRDRDQRAVGRHRWVIERTLAWLERYRRLAVRYERRANIH